MTRHDETQLWAYAGRSLERDEAQVLEHHLEECPECEEKLEAVVLAREALLLARQSRPLIAWATVDSRIDTVIDRRLRAKTSRRWAWVPVAALAVAGLLAIIAHRDAPQISEAAPLPPLVEAARPDSHVERARGLQISGARVDDGAKIEDGDVLQTTGSEAKALVYLADRSQLRVAGGTKLTVQRAGPDEVVLALARGRVAVRASHESRKDFVVRSGEVDVHVIGTVFAVTRNGDVTEVGVSEGRVRVEIAGSGSVTIGPGQRARFSGRNVQRSALTPLMKRELSEVQGASDEPLAPPMAVVPALGGPLPRLDPREAKARQVIAAAPVTQTFEPLTEVLVEAPPSPPNDKKVTPESEWASLPAPPVPAAAKPIARDLESLFLQKAEAALTKGTCESFMLGLEEVANDAQINERTELARILRARCFDIGLRPKQAMVEYRKYLETYPAGRYVAEAREAMGQ